MIQYYLDLQKQVKAIHDRHLDYGQIQKIYSTSFFISFSIRTPGKTWHLYFGRGGGQEGLWLGDQSPPSPLRRRDNFLEYLRKHISSCSFVSVDLDQYDRIVKLSYQKFGELHSILLFWKARKLYFVHHYQDAPDAAFKLLLSWQGKAIILNQPPEDLFTFFDDVGRRIDMKHDLQSSSFNDIDKLLEDELNAAKSIGLHSAPTFLQRKIQNIEQDLSRAKQWNLMQKVLDQNDPLDMYEIKIGEHKVKFEGELTPYERRNLLFEKIKKLKRGEGILNQRLDQTKELLQGKNKETLPHSTLPLIRPVWGKETSKSSDVAQKTVEKDQYKIYKFDHFSVGVGNNSSGNDQLRNKWAGKEDTWLHLDGDKSAHAIIKLNNSGPLDPEMLHLAASILAYSSRFNGDWIPIIYTAVKNLKGVTGSPGMVIYKKEKHLRCPKLSTAFWLKE
jgi:predicted ribosome quality control (RQC) complex YloA/Tae2 family protein